MTTDSEELRERLLRDLMATPRVENAAQKFPRMYPDQWRMVVDRILALTHTEPAGERIEGWAVWTYEGAMSFYEDEPRDRHGVFKDPATLIIHTEEKADG